MPNDAHKEGCGTKFRMIECKTTDILNFKITNFEIAKDELFDYFIYKFIFYYYGSKLFEHSKYLIIFLNFLNC